MAATLNWLRSHSRNQLADFWLHDKEEILLQLEEGLVVDKGEALASLSNLFCQTMYRKSWKMKLVFKYGFFKTASSEKVRYNQQGAKCE